MGTPAQTLPPPTPPAPRKIHTAQLVTAMLKSHTQISDLIFSPGRAPQVEVSGQLIELKFKGLESLTPQDTSFLAYDIMGKNETPARTLEKGRLTFPTGSPALLDSVSTFSGSVAPARL